MERSKLIAGALVLAVGAGVAIYNATWKKFSPEDGSFTVTMPSIGSHDDQKIETPLGPASFHVWESVSGGYDYGVGYWEFPAAVFQMQDGSGLLGMARDGMRQQLTGGRVKSETDIPSAAVPTREWIMEGQYKGSPVVLKVRVYVVKDKHRLYLIGVKTPPGEETSRNAKRFMDSFAIQGSR